MTMEWQPIETAPKDGSEFLAWCCQRHPFGPARCFPDIAHWHIGRHENTSYFQSRSCAIPTHWMPLPPPPAPTTKE